ncbi:MAG: nucleotidyltransferase domain-containing protein [Alphaproteobacteria bacterium]|nr:nucleotidyltransferase domain-containing protein [Alphaproteobacteria bacterium]
MKRASASKSTTDGTGAEPMERIDPASIHEAMPGLVERLGALGARRVILYGSRARGDHAPRADIDLAIDWPGHDSRDWLAVSDAIDEARTLLEFDFVFLEDAKGGYLENILRDGKVLYERG